MAIIMTDIYTNKQHITMKQLILLISILFIGLSLQAQDIKTTQAATTVTGSNS